MTKFDFISSHCIYYNNLDARSIKTIKLPALPSTIKLALFFFMDLTAVLTITSGIFRDPEELSFDISLQERIFVRRVYM